MAISFHTNMSASKAYLGLEKANVMMKESLNRLSSGQRIASVADDAGGLSVAYKLRSKLDRNEQVVNNLANASSFLDVQQGALDSVGNILSRMSELKTMSLDVTKHSGDTENYDKEFKELQLQLGKISHQKFNGVSLFSNQIPEVLFWGAVDLELLKQTADEDDLNKTVNITRWGLRRFLSQTLEAGDKPPSGFGEVPPREFLSMVFTNESLMDTTGNNKSWNLNEYYDGWKRSYYDHAVIFPPGTNWGMDTEDPIFIQDKNNGIGFLGTNNFSAKIGVVTQDNTALIPDHWVIPGISDENIDHDLKENHNIAVDYFQRDDVGGDGLMLEKDGGTAETQLANFKNAFLKLTNNDTELPGALVLNVDNSKSMGGFKELNEGILAFKDWVETTYPEVFVPNQTSDNFQKYLDPVNSMQNGVSIGSNENGYFLGIRINEGEDYIRQGRLAIEDAVSEYTNSTGDEISGTLDDDASGLKSLLDSVYDLADFDMADFEGFIQALSNALAVNGAESQAVDFKAKELNQTFVNSEQAHGRIMDADIAQESTRFAKHNVLLQASATMMVHANQLSELALSLIT